MSFFDFRAFLDDLDSNGDLFRVPVEVDTLDEMGAFIARADYEGVNSPILFEKPKGFDIPVLANTVGHTYKRMADAFGVAEDNALPGSAMKMMQVLKSGGVPPVYVDAKKAACKDVIMKGDDVDLSMIPALRLNPQDGQGVPNFAEGRYFTSLCVSKPTENAHNLSYHRFEITGKNTGTAWIFRGTGDAFSMEKFWGSKIDAPSSSWDYDNAKPFPMAFVFGVTPEFILAGANSALPYENDDFAFIGGLRDTPVEMVKCETIDVDVPANAEIIVEGEFKPFNWATQGQFASFNGFYDVPRRRPIFDVTAITMRKNPIFQHVHIGRPLNECNSIAAFFRSVRTFLQIKEIMPNVVDVFVDPIAGCGFTVYVSIRKARIGEPKMAMMRAYTALAGFCKHVFVYDDDIDIRDHKERDWALAHRFIPDRDLMIIPNVLGMNIEPMAQGVLGSNSKLGVYDGYPEIPLNVRSFMGVDCTVPINLKVMDRVVPIPEIESRVDYLWNQVID
ncbi:MAG: UbiD family decarboxylase [Proteobacteria bacterium]|nr:UbiD family decarboxylase [Pseudomonadota bacterium]